MTQAFEHASALPWLIATLGAASLWVTASLFIAGRRSRSLLGPRDRVTRGGTGVGSDVVLLVALAATFVAWLGPMMGEREIAVSGAGADVVILLDVSQSMDARDVPPSRLVRARAGAAELLRGLAEGDRVALAGFAGRGVAFTPLTPDRAALARMLPALDSRLIRPGGSDLGAGLEAALPLFEAGGKRPRVLVVFGDGETSRPVDAQLTTRARRSGVRIVSVALGLEAGTTVPDAGAPLRDAHDRVVTSRRDPATLAALARDTDGLLLLADEWGTVPADALVAAVDRDIASAREAEPTGSTRRIAVAETRPFAALAFLLLILEPLTRRRAGPAVTASEADRPGRLRAATATSALCVLAALQLGVDGSASDARDQLARGFALADAGRTEEARLAFEAAAVLADDPRQIAVAHHDLGVLALERDDLVTARDHFFDALIFAPEDHQMRFNAEWTLMALRARSDADEPEPAPSDDTRPPPESSPTDPTAAPPPTEAGPDETDPAAGPGEGEALESDRPAKESGGGTAASASGLATPSRPLLDEGERARWLERVKDDPGRAMRLTARAEGETGRPPRRGSATW